MHWLAIFQHWVAVHTGTINEPGPYYGFWSGFGSDIGELAIIGGLIQLYRKHQCAVGGCRRLGRLKTGDHVVCIRHHPTGEPTHTDILTAHHKARQ